MSWGGPLGLGELATALKLVTPEQLDSALQAQSEARQGGTQEKLGAILVRQGSLTKAQLSFLLSCQPAATYQCPECKQTLTGQPGAGAPVCPRCGRPAVVVVPADTRATTLIKTVEEPTTPSAPGPPADEAPTHREIAGLKYQIIQMLGKGGMGAVYLAWDPELRRRVAIKRMRDQMAPDDRARVRFEREARNAAALVHPNIVTVHAVDFTPPEYAIVMEYVEGVSLKELAARGPLPPRRVAQLLRDVARAVHYAHEKHIVHRDLKPTNILIDARGAPKVADFGLAKNLLVDIKVTRETEIAGTPPYMSPEHFAGPDAIRPASDIFSLGVILYELLTAQLPHPGTSVLNFAHSICHVSPRPPRQLSPNVHPDLETICMKCLEKQPQHRFATAGALADELDRYIRGEPLTIRPPTFAERCLRWARKNRRTVAAVGLAVLLMAGLGLGIRELQRRADARRDTEAAVAAVAELRAACAAGRFEEAVRLARSAAPLYADVPETEAIRGWLGTALYETGNESEAADVLIRTFCDSKSEEARAQALLMLARDRYDQDDLETALKAMDKLSARWPNTLAAVEAAYWRGHLLLAAGQEGAAAESWNLAQDAPQLPPRLREAAAECLANLTPLLPCARIEMPVVQFVLGKVLPGEAQQIVLAKGNELRVAQWDGRGLQTQMAWRRARHKRIYPILVADVAGDRVPAIALSDAKPVGKHELVVLKRIGHALRECFRFPMQANLPFRGAAAGDVDHDGRPELVVIAGCYGRQPYVFKFTDRGRVLPTPICQDLPDSASEAEGVAIGDVDGDGLNEIVLATSAWGAYDLRVCEFDFRTRKYPITWQQPLGTLKSVRVLDLDGDGTQEIAFCKAHTDNAVIFGPNTRSGPIPEGIHVFRHLAGDYVPVTSIAFEKGTRGHPEGNDTVCSLCSGDIDGDGRPDLAAVFERILPGGSRGIAWVNVYRNLGGFCFSRLTIPVSGLGRPVIDMGDIDGDGRAELLVSSEHELRLYGVEQAPAPTSSDKAPRPETATSPGESPPLAPWALTAAQDLLELKSYAAAEGQFRNALTMLSSEDDQRRAWNGILASFEGRKDHAGLVRALGESIEVFPQEAGEARVRQIEALITMGRWNEAAKTAKSARAILPQDDPLTRRVRRSEEVLADMCAEPTQLFATSFDPAPDLAAFAASPFRARIVRPGGYLRFLSANRSMDRLWIPVQWQGESFELTYDVMVEDLKWDSAVAFGLISWPPDEEQPDGFWHNFWRGGGGSAVGGGGEHWYTSGFHAGLRSKHVAGTHPDDPWQKRLWYRIRMLYIRPLSELRCEVRERDTGEVFSKSRIELENKEWPPGPYGLGLVAPPVSRSAEKVGAARLSRVRLLRFGAPRRKAPPLPLREEERIVLEGNGHYTLGRFAQAEACYRAAVSRQPKNLRLAVRLAAAQARKGEIRSAFAALVAAYDVEPGYLPALSGLPEVLSRHQIQDMLAKMKREHAAKPPEVRSRILEALAHLYLNELPQADAILGSLVPHERARPELAYHRGHVALHMGNLDQASRLFDESIRALPEWPFAYRKRAILHEHMKDFEAAASDYRRYLRLRPQHARAWLVYGECLARVGADKRSTPLLHRARDAFRRAYWLANAPRLRENAAYMLRRVTHQLAELSPRSRSRSR